MTEEQKSELLDQEPNEQIAEPAVEKPLTELEDLKTEITSQKEKYLRLFAEFDNYKKRTIKERIELIRNASEELILELLVVLDDFDRAKKLSQEQNNEQIFPEGMRLVHHKLTGLLKSKGLEEMKTEGMIFDPQFHEAITEIDTPDESMKGKIFDTIEKGYTLNHKIIRYAKVVVAK